MGNLPVKLERPVVDEIEDYGSQIKITPSVWHWPDASPGSRLIAFVMDTTIISAIYGLISVLAERSVDTRFVGLLQPLIVLLYFCIFQSRTGQTPGKQIVGIRVVTLEQNDGDLRIPLGRIIRRECLGRFLNVLSLGIGYVFIIFKADHMGLHDRLARTRVVRISENAGSAFKIRYVIGAVAVIFFSLVGYGYYCYRYTTLPLRQVAAKLETSGFTFDSLEGSLERGFSIGGLTFENDDMRLELKGLTFAAKLDEKTSEHKLKVTDLVIESGHVVMKRFVDSGRPTSMTDKKETEGPFGIQSTRHARISLPSAITVSTVDVTQFEVSLPGRPTYHVKRAFLSGLEINPSVNTTSLARLYIESDALSANFQDILAQEKRLSFGKQATLQLMPALEPDVIAKPIDIQFEGFFENGKPTQLKLTAFSNTLQAKWFESSGEVVVHELTPLNYFKTELPLWKMNFKVAMDEKHVKIEQLQGSIGIRNVQFNMDSLGFVNQRGVKKYTLVPRLSADWKSMLAGRDPGFVLGSSDHQTARDTLTELYFGRPFVVLTADQKSMVEKDVRFFADTVDAGAPPPVPMKIVKLPVPAPRQPTSYVKPAVHAQVASRIPTKLPPYRGKHK